MSNMSTLQGLENRLNTGSLGAVILGVPIYKGMVGQVNNYRFVINSSDHNPPHIHIAVNNQQIAKYDLVSGECIEAKYPNLNKIFDGWYTHGENRELAIAEWIRFHGPVIDLQK